METLNDNERKIYDVLKHYKDFESKPKLVFITTTERFRLFRFANYLCPANAEDRKNWMPANMWEFEKRNIQRGFRFVSFPMGTVVDVIIPNDGITVNIKKVNSILGFKALLPYSNQNPETDL